MYNLNTSVFAKIDKLSELNLIKSQVEVSDTTVGRKTARKY